MAKDKKKEEPRTHKWLKRNGLERKSFDLKPAEWQRIEDAAIPIKLTRKEFIEVFFRYHFENNWEEKVKIIQSEYLESLKPAR